MARAISDNALSENATKIEKSRALGEGTLPLVITGIRQLTPRVRMYELQNINGEELPLIAAGAHLKVPVLPETGNAEHGSNELEKNELRQYSICSNPTRRDAYEIAVLHEADGKGGSAFIHDFFSVGLRLNCELPNNHFPLHADTSPSVLIAGGIGITPLKTMVHTLLLRGRRVQLHYCGRSLNEMAFYEELSHELGANFFSYIADQGNRLDVMHLLGDAPHNAIFYVCGPHKLMDDVYSSAIILGIPKDRIHSEAFSIKKQQGNKPITVELARSNKTIHVRADQTILAAVHEAGVAAKCDCRIGECAACAVKVIQGQPDHRDMALNEASHAKGMMCICVSRAKSEKLILDL